MRRDTRSGQMLESAVCPALSMGGYEIEKQKKIGKRIGGGTHRVDALASKEGRKILVSLKWQEVNGTAEQKVPFEVLCLKKALEEGAADCAYLVLGGEGWTLKQYYIERLREDMPIPKMLRIVSFEHFLKLARRGLL